MSNAVDLSDPPHLWARLLPDGPLYLALSGSLPHSELGEKLRRPDVLQLAQPGRVTVALLDATGFGPVEQGHVFHLTVFAKKLLEAGCKRLAAATAPGQGALLTSMLAGLPGKVDPTAQVACFEQQLAASQWLFSSEPAPSFSRADTARVSGSTPTEPVSSSGAPTFGAPAPPPPPPAPPPGPPQVSPAPSPLHLSAATRPSAQPLQGAAPRATELLPLLLDGSLEATRCFLGRPLLPSLAGRLEHNPMVTVATGEAPRRFALLRGQEDAPGLLDELLAEAIVHLERAEIPMEVCEHNGRRYARSISPLAAEGILSPKFLGKLQDVLGSRVIAVAVPRQGTLLATQANPDNGTMLQAIAGMARELFSSAKHLAVAPGLFLVDGGKVMGPLKIESAAPPSTRPQALPAQALKVLPARTVAEANLYMDLRGAEAGPRNHRLVEVGGDLVSLYEARCFDEATPTRFAFKIENTTAPPGVLGGPRPSQILAPDEFLFWADRLSKQVPASPEGLAAEPRRRARQMLETAASCLLEAAKFIPPGAERVPEERMALRHRWEQLSITPGRFDRARLEIVAKTYNNLASKF